MAIYTDARRLYPRKYIRPRLQIMRMEKRKREDASIVDVNGEVHIGTAPEFRMTLLEELRKPDVLKLIVDLTQVPYMDSSGLAVLLEALRTARDQKTRLVLCGLGEEVRGLLQLTRLLSVFEHYSTAEEALRALA